VTDDLGCRASSEGRRSCSSTRTCLVLIVLGATGTSCGPGPAPKLPAAKLEVETQTKSQILPPVWAARFSSPTQLTSCVELDEKSRLCVGELGERWLDTPGATRASPHLAPEALVAAIPAAAGHWDFVGRHGTRYRAETPIGPFTSMQRSHQRYTRFAVVAGRWYGLTDNGELWRGLWGDKIGARVQLTEPLFDFAVSPAGQGVALALPERIWTSQDQGAHWNALDTDPVGASSVSVDAEGRLSLTALLPKKGSPPQDYTISDAKTAHGMAIKLRHAPAEFVEVQAFTEGRAAHLGSELVELRKSGDLWRVAGGRIDAPFEFTQTQGLEGCAALRLSVSSGTTAVICRNDDGKGKSIALSLRVSDSRALNFTRLTGPIFGRFNEVRVAALDDRHILATGLCAPDNSSLNVEPSKSQSLVNAKHLLECVPKSAVLIELTYNMPGKPRAFSLKSVAAPGAYITAPPIAVSRDGQLAAFVARPATIGPWQLYLSVDAGKTFAPHPIDTLPITGAAPSPKQGREGSQHEQRSVQSLHFADDRSLSLVLKQGDTPVAFNFDDRGHLIAAAMPPPETSRMDAVGSRILAVSLTRRDVYESMDRGASFEIVGHLPAAACLTLLGCPVVCSSSGCLIGERFTRLSWGGSGAVPLDIAGNPETGQPDFEPQSERVAFRATLMCKPDGASIHNLFSVQRAPMPEQVSLHDTLWYSPWQDFVKGSAGVYRVQRGRRHVDQLPAFAPIVPAQVAGLASSFNDTGLTFLRSQRVPKVGDDLGELEIYWLNFQRPAWLHARFRDALPIKMNDTYLYGAGRARRLLPALLSVSGDGVFVQPHADDEHQLGAYFATAHGVVPIEKVPWPLERIRDQHLTKGPEFWQIHAFDETGAVLLRGQKALGASVNHNAWEFVAQTVANPRGSSFDIHERVYPYWGGNRSVLFLGTAARGRELQSLSIHALTSGAQPLGPAISITPPASLSDPPPACDARDRREFTRVVVPLLPGATRAVGIEGADAQPSWLLAQQAVLYAGTSRSCVDVLWAESLPGTSPVTAVITLNDLREGWLFRTRRVNGEDKLEAQPMKCQYDVTGNRPPPELETRAQVRWNLDNLQKRPATF